MVTSNHKYFEEQVRDNRKQVSIAREHLDSVNKQQTRIQAKIDGYFSGAIEETQGFGTSLSTGRKSWAQQLMLKNNKGQNANKLAIQAQPSYSNKRERKLFSQEASRHQGSSRRRKQQRQNYEQSRQGAGKMQLKFVQRNQSREFDSSYDSECESDSEGYQPFSGHQNQQTVKYETLAAPKSQQDLSNQITRMREQVSFISQIIVLTLS